MHGIGELKEFILQFIYSACDSLAERYRGWTLEMYLDEQNGITKTIKLTLWSHLKNQEYEAGLVCGYASYLFIWGLEFVQ